MAWQKGTGPDKATFEVRLEFIFDKTHWRTDDDLQQQDDESTI